MRYELIDDNGNEIKIGSLVEYRENWRHSNQRRMAGVVMEITFRVDGEPKIKVSGAMNRNLYRSDVTVITLNKREMTLLDAFVSEGVVPDIDKIREILGELCDEQEV